MRQWMDLIPLAAAWTMWNTLRDSNRKRFRVVGKVGRGAVHLLLAVTAKTATGGGRDKCRRRLTRHAPRHTLAWRHSSLTRNGTRVRTRSIQAATHALEMYAGGIIRNILPNFDLKVEDPSSPFNGRSSRTGTMRE